MRAKQSRDYSGPTYHAPHQQTSSILNILNTHGIGLSASIGAGVRYANADSHQSDHPENTPAPSSSSVFDRYLGSTWHIGLNTHLGNNKQDHQGIAQQAGGGSLPIVAQQDDEERSDIAAPTNRPTESIWERLHKYFAWNRLTAGRCDGNNGRAENACDNYGTSNIFTRLFARYFVRETPRSENRLLSDPNDQENFFSKVNTLTEYMRRGDPRQTVSIKNDFDVFRNTIKYYLLERFTAFVTQNTTNEGLLYKMVKNSLLQVMGESHGNARTDDELLVHLSRYFTNDKIRELFPDIVRLRNNLVSRKIQSEKDYNDWFRDNFSVNVGKYYLNTYNAFPSKSDN